MQQYHRVGKLQLKRHLLNSLEKTALGCFSSCVFIGMRWVQLHRLCLHPQSLPA